MKNIQIPKELFLALCNYHLAGIRSPEQDQRIQQGLHSGKWWHYSVSKSGEWIWW